MNKTITQISVSKLFAHPYNPRTDLGDLTELTDSIIQNGIFQNLTVVPKDEMQDYYTVIIGHRRLQAAKNAGLESVPCAIVHMDSKEQAATMLLENMQRSDLTMYEQAQGIQMCLDLGMTETDISTQTGFSKTTVRRRVKMLDLDQDKVETAVNATLDDYILLEDIEDIDERNRLVDFIGTNNFKLEVERSKQEQFKVLKKENTVKDDELNSTTEEPHLVKIDEIITLSKTLRINFIKELFKNKMTGKEISAAAGVISLMAIFRDIKINNKLLHEIVNPNGVSDDTLKKHLIKHKSNYFVVTAFVALESFGHISSIYEYLIEIGYVLSDEESEMLENAKD